MLITLILWPALHASTSRALPASEVGPRVAVHSARNKDLHDRVEKFLESKHLRLMLFQDHAGSPEFVDYVTHVHPLVPTELAAHFLVALARLEVKFAARHEIGVAEFRREVDTLLVLAAKKLRPLDPAAVAEILEKHPATAGAPFARAFVASVRAMEAPLIPSGAPALSDRFFTNFAAHLEGVLAEWPERFPPNSIEVPVTIARAGPPPPASVPDPETIGLLRQALNLDACANAFAVTDEDLTPEVAPAAAAAAIEATPAVTPDAPVQPTRPAPK